MIKVRTTSNSKLIYSSHNMATLARALDNGLGTWDLRIGLAHTSHMCLIGPRHYRQCVHKIAFGGWYYFKRYAMFCNTKHSVFYLILRSCLNILCPRLSSDTQNTDFLENGAKPENLKLMFFLKSL